MKSARNLAENLPNKIDLCYNKGMKYDGRLNLIAGGFKGHQHSPAVKAKIGEASRGEKSYLWKGGRTKTKAGYIQIRLYPDDFFYSMANASGRVFEHRLVVAKALGRCLHLWEIVHHKKGFAKDDNRHPETLQLVSDDRHKQISILERRIKQLEKRLEGKEAMIEKLLDKIYAIPTQYRRELRASKALRAVDNLTQEEAQAILDNPEFWAIPKQKKEETSGR